VKKFGPFSGKNLTERRGRLKNSLPAAQNFD
jgi:hypothetical protein